MGPVAAVYVPATKRSMKERVQKTGTSWRAELLALGLFFDTFIIKGYCVREQDEGGLQLGPRDDTVTQNESKQDASNLLVEALDQLYDRILSSI